MFFLYFSLSLKLILSVSIALHKTKAIQFFTMKQRYYYFIFCYNNQHLKTSANLQYIS